MSTRLVVLVGPNGSGKSSLFEAFNFWISPSKNDISFQPDFHWKEDSSNPENIKKNWHELHNHMTIEFYDKSINPRERSLETQKAFYFRSSYRHETDFERNGVGTVDDALIDAMKPKLMIMPDIRVSDNYSRLVAKVFDEIFDWEKDGTYSELRDKLITKIRHSMLNVFGELILTGTGNPMNKGTFLFEKGLSRNFKYKNLSAGEKAAFDLLLDFIIKTEVFDDTVFCIDEPELHMHTRLQTKLLDELFNNLPPNCQLWIATHSIGMMRRAMELHQEKCDEVIFLDFENHDFDQPVTLYPQKVDRQFWKRVFKVALDDLAELVAPSEIVFCEGRPEGAKSGQDISFDAEIYRRIFQELHPDTEFIPLGGRSEIEKNALLIKNSFMRLFSTLKMWSLFDRDDSNDEEILELSRKGVRVLRYRDIENYLWADEIIQKLCEIEGQLEKFNLIGEAKKQLLDDLASQGKSRDDVKAIKGPLYSKVRDLLNIRQRGNTHDAFCKAVLAPLITPETQTYKELEEDVFGRNF